MTTPEPSLEIPAKRGSISIAIISKGRPEILNDTLESIFKQSLQPENVVLAVPTAADLPSKDWSSRVTYIVGPLGTTFQRNRAFEAIPLSVDYVGFFDDDFELEVDYLAEAIDFFDRNPNAMALSGHVLAEGGVTREQAQRMIADLPPFDPATLTFKSSGKWHTLHGCNMVIRRSVLELEPFDENLPLYAFAEDYDISIRIERHGLVGRYNRCIGVHLASPGGRVNEVLRGYAYVANSYYFLKKGVMHLPPFWSWLRFWAITGGWTIYWILTKIITRDKTSDWKGRLKGVLLAFYDLARGRCRPDRILEL